MNMLRRTGAALAVLAATLFGPAAIAQVIIPGPNEPNFINLLDNGTFNTYQAGTTAVTGITSTATYHADRWAGFGGASSSVSLTNVTTSLPTQFSNAERLQRAAANTNTVAIHLVQEIPTADITPLASQALNLSCWAKADANFSGTGLTASVGTGTGTDEGLATYISGFAGAATPITGVWPVTTTWTRFTLTGNLGAGVTEAVFDLNYAPAGTAGTTDGVEVTGCQTSRGTQLANFEWRPISIERIKLFKEFYRLAEPASGAGVPGFCQATGANTNQCTLNLPVQMRATTPTIAITTAGTFKVNIAGTATTIATPTAGTCGSSACTVTAANTNTAGQAESLTGGGGSGKWDVNGNF